jgi:hypothetical protein
MGFVLDVKGVHLICINSQLHYRKICIWAEVAVGPKQSDIPIWDNGYGKHFKITIWVTILEIAQELGL